MEDNQEGAMKLKVGPFRFEEKSLENWEGLGLSVGKEERKTLRWESWMG